MKKTSNFREYKKEIIGDPELFNELEEREVERWNEKIKAQILSIASKRSISINEDELLDIILDILKNRLYLLVKVHFMDLRFMAES